MRPRSQGGALVQAGRRTYRPRPGNRWPFGPEMERNDELMSTNLYDDPILRLAESTGNQDRMESPDRQATATNALCGDRVTVQLEMSGPGIVRLAYQVRGCLLCRASCAVLAALATGLDLERLKNLRNTLERFLKSSAADLEVPRELHVFAAVRPRKSRHRCVLLPYDAALKALGSAGVSD